MADEHTNEKTNEHTDENTQDDDIDLSALGDDDLVAQMHDDLYDGLADEIAEATEILLQRGWSAQRTLNEALVEGMRIVGIDFRDGILFVPEVLLSANAMKAGMAILQPLLIASNTPRMGKIVVGTVKGDIHDIGKNLVAMMMEGAGFEVVDLGIDLSENGQALDAIHEVGPGGHFLGCAHTQKNFEQAFYLSQIADNNSLEQWEIDGSLDATARANSLWKQMLADYEAPSLDPGIDEALIAFMDAKKAAEPDSAY